MLSVIVDTIQRLYGHYSTLLPADLFVTAQLRLAASFIYRQWWFIGEKNSLANYHILSIALSLSFIVISAKLKFGFQFYLGKS